MAVPAPREVGGRVAGGDHEVDRSDLRHEAVDVRDRVDVGIDMDLSAGRRDLGGAVAVLQADPAGRATGEEGCQSASGIDLRCPKAALVLRHAMPTTSPG